MNWVDLVRLGLAISKMIAEISTYTGDDKIVSEAQGAFGSYQRIHEAIKNKAASQSLRLTVTPWPKG